MAVAFRSIATKKYGLTVDCTVTKPSGAVDGDLLVAFLTQGNATPVAVGTPAGWTLVQTFTDLVDAGSFHTRNYVYTKVASGEGANWTWTHTSSNTEGTVLALTGADLVTPISPSLPAALNTSGVGVNTTCTATGVTTPCNDSLVIFFGQDFGNDVITLTAPTGSTPTFTERATCTVTALQSIATGVLAVAGATGDKSQACNSSSAQPRGGVLVSIQPPQAATPLTPQFTVGITHILQPIKMVGY